MKNNPTVASTRYHIPLKEEAQTTSFSGVSLFLFKAAVFYTAVPIVDLPLFGLSLSAPLLLIVMLEIFLHPPESWLKKYRSWVMPASAIWLGICASGVINGLLDSGDIKTAEVISILRYGFWLTTFVATTYLVSRAQLGERLVRLLAIGVFLLAVLRWYEALFLSRLGSGEALGRIFFFQNEYGFYFSSFVPLFLVPLVAGRGIRKLLVFSAMLIVLGAVALNGSRGSWVSISLGFLLFVLMYLRVDAARLPRLLPVAALLGAFFVGFLYAPNQIVSAVSERLASLQSIDEEKSTFIRELMIQKGWRLFLGSPLLGVGPGQFVGSSVELAVPYQLNYAPQSYFDTKSAHNSYIGLLAETGLAGSLSFVALWLMLILRGYRAALRLGKQSHYWGVGIYVSFIVMSVHMMAVSSLTTTSTWMMYGYVAAMTMYPTGISSDGQTTGNTAGSASVRS